MRNARATETGTRARTGNQQDQSPISNPVRNAKSVPATRIIPPLCWHGGDPAGFLMDRVALHLRKQVPERFGAMTLDDITLIFDELRDEIRRVCATGLRDEED
jgi:hypothetical protein